MSELVSLGVRLDKKIVSELNRIADEEHVDRTTIIRKLISAAPGNYKKNMVLRKYEQGQISISKAAIDSGFTVGKIEEYIVREGYRSKSSVRDLKRELELLKEWIGFFWTFQSKIIAIIPILFNQNHYPNTTQFQHP